MTLLAELIDYNQKFVESKSYEPYRTTKFPDKKMAIITCMDARLTELMPKALNLHNGDAKIIKNAGAVVSHPFGSVMRSILVAVYQLEAEEIFVIGHHGCGMTGLNPDEVVHKAKERGVSDITIETLQHAGIDLNRWLTGFDYVRDSVIGSVNIIRNHPLLPRNLPVHGLIISPETGELEIVLEGYASTAAVE
ncbi:beta-class carbonic anhydrase [Paenibacillus thalictri]|uniref:carbonic anhydrase n=1 Tax=Paenibacillus thalictri TaxID=2527873 RepID=A0A4Q9DW09_9BACL|nr:carbonic anhydrase [Paenibacillus thalictri]TBL80179.1 carbonic anhydrase [Paenibacillus thalictri]